tara:strand:+ start:24 stop:383 length:360 start_codon:yes stop_codon:yes gene_type:complete
MEKKNIIFVENFETYCFIGIYPKEKKEKQKLKISVRLEFKRENFSDKLSNTLSYEEIITYLKEIENFKHINLVETLADNICNHFERFNEVNNIEIKLVKCNLLNNKTDVGFILKKSFAI